MNYLYPSKPQRFLRRGKMIDVDSSLERRVIELLDGSGYSEHLFRPKGGFGFGSQNDSWTPDLQLAVEYSNRSVCAFVEIKPTLEHFDLGLQSRIAKVAKKHGLKLVLLSVDRPRGWCHFDLKTGQVIAIELPPPAINPRVLKPIEKYGYTWKNPLFSASKLFIGLIDLLQELILAPLGRPSRYKRRKH